MRHVQPVLRVTRRHRSGSGGTDPVVLPVVLVNEVCNLSRLLQVRDVAALRDHRELPAMVERRRRRGTVSREDIEWMKGECLRFLDHRRKLVSEILRENGVILAPNHQSWLRNLPEESCIALHEEQIRHSVWRFPMPTYILLRTFGML